MMPDQKNFTKTTENCEITVIGAAGAELQKHQHVNQQAYEQLIEAQALK